MTQAQHQRNDGWGEYASTAQLPNVAAAAVQDVTLQRGDTAFISPNGLYICLDATVGAAVWVLIPPGGGTSTQNYYVSDINGNDANTGLSPAAAFKTVTKAESVVPINVLGPTIIHVGRHNTTGYTMPTWRQRDLAQPLVVIGDGAGQAGETGFTELLASTAAIAGSTQFLITITGPIGVNAFRGKTIEILTGPAAGDRRTIALNDATTIRPVKAFSAAVAATNTFRIVEPSVNFVFPAAIHRLADVQGDMKTADGTIYAPALYFINTKWTITASTALHNFASLVLLGVEVASAGAFSITWRGTGSVYVGLDQTSPAATQVGATLFAASATTSWAGWAFALFGTGSHIFTRQESAGWIVASRLFIQGGTHMWYGGNAYTNGCSVNGGGILLPGVMTAGEIGYMTGANALVASDRAVITTAFPSVGALVVSATTSAIVATTKSCMVLSGANITGSGATFGTLAGSGAQVNYSGAPLVTGTTGDLSVDGVTAQPNATIAANGDGIVNFATLSAIMRGT